MPRLVVQRENEEVIMAYMDKERKRLQYDSSDKRESPYVTITEGLFSCTDCYGAYLDEVLVGFCIVPTYAPNVCARIYVEYASRRNGIGNSILKHLDIRSLGCLNTNVKALAFYKAVGFVMESSNGWITNLVRAA